MADINKTVRINELLALYQELLTPTQKECMVSYYVYDLSFGEIASEHNISRAAVEDAIKKSCKKLDEYESKLHLLEKKEILLKKTAKLKEFAKNNDEIKIINEIEGSVKDGI